MTAFLFNMPWSQVFDSSGNTLAGAKLYFYDAGTTTLKNIYTDSDLTVAAANPVIADGSGRFAPIYTDGQPFKVMLYTASGDLIWSADNVVNQSVAASVQFALDAINETMTSAGYSGGDLDVATNFPKAVFKYGNNALYYDTGDTANRYVLEPQGNNLLRPDAYFEGMEVIFECTRQNTGSTVTVNVDSLGDVSVYRTDGTQLSAGDLFGTVHLIYNGSKFLLIETNYDQFVIGDIKSSVRSADHGGWLICDGRAVSRTTYAILYGIIGDNFGAGDGSTTFNLPDYRGKFLRGLGGDSAADIYTTQAEGLPNISGSFELDRCGGTGGADGGAKVTGAFSKAEGTLVGPSGSNGVTNVISFDASDSDAIYGASSHVTPINQAVNYFIKAR